MTVAPVTLDAQLAALNKQQQAMVAAAVGGWRPGRNLGLILAGLLVAGVVYVATPGQFLPTAVAFAVAPAILLVVGSLLDRDTRAARELVLWTSLRDRDGQAGTDAGRTMAAFQPERDAVNGFLKDGVIDTREWVATAQKLDDPRQRNWNLVRAALFEATDVYVRHGDWRRFLADRRRSIADVQLSSRARRLAFLLLFVPSLIWLIVSAIGVAVFAVAAG